MGDAYRRTSPASPPHPSAGAGRFAAEATVSISAGAYCSAMPARICRSSKPLPLFEAQVHLEADQLVGPLDGGGLGNAACAQVHLLDGVVFDFGEQNLRGGDGVTGVQERPDLHNSQFPAVELGPPER